MTVARALRAVVRINLLLLALVSSYQIRLFAVQNYGRVIHEFDPWFNYRAAEYLKANGAERFFKWFDHTVWYPLGRPVGTTIYPGMQFAAVWIWQILKMAQVEMSLHDVCVFIPAWFGVASTVFLALLTYECTRCVDSALCAMMLVAILPAHLMRSVAGGFDNECVAISLMNATFYFWCRSLRDAGSWPWAALAGLSYFCMVATWGGYIYVVNIIGFHAACLMLWRHSSKLHRAYSLFFLVGTSLAVQVPVVAWTPLRSLEQLGPLLQLLALQLWEALAIWQRNSRLKAQEFRAYRLHALLACGALATLLGASLFQAGYFAPLSGRVRGLFVKHRTGNPLVDSVAEHQATSPRAYWQFFHHTCTLAPVGFALCALGINEAKSFLLLYGAVTYYFSAKMNRLILLLGPIAAALGGTAMAKGLAWSIGQLTGQEEVPATIAAKMAAAKASPSAKSKGGKKGKEAGEESLQEMLTEIQDELTTSFQEAYYEATWQKTASAVLLLCIFGFCGMEFVNYCWAVGERLSQASIIVRRMGPNNELVLMDDYRESYWWLKENTPLDTRVMAWWDYGYQINGLSERITLADGNTWNHEHIALLGRCLTGPERQSHEVIRHLADYVLIWAGEQGDDIAKSPHMARIAASVYPDVCPDDPLCSQFVLERQSREPSEMMRRSLLWRLYTHGGNATAHPELFQEAYTSKYGLVRIFKVLNVSEESKRWAMDPSNWRCDAPGSWHCSGQYPPALSEVLKKQKAFPKLGDFNDRQKDVEGEEYYKAYMQKVKVKDKARR